MEKLASLKPLHPEIEGFSITAGNARGQRRRRRRGGQPTSTWPRPPALELLATVRAWASVGVARRDRPGPDGRHPEGPRPGRARVGDIDLWEVNEAFAAMCVATAGVLDIDDELVNVLGSGCSLGHPIAMTGARMIISLVHELRRARRGDRRGRHVRHGVRRPRSSSTPRPLTRRLRRTARHPEPRHAPAPPAHAPFPLSLIVALGLVAAACGNSDDEADAQPSADGGTAAYGGAATCRG